MPIDLKNTNNFIEKFNYIVKNPDYSVEQEQYMDNYMAHLAIALVDDFGKPLMKRVSNIISAICLED